MLRPEDAVPLTNTRNLIPRRLLPNKSPSEKRRRPQECQKRLEPVKESDDSSKVSGRKGAWCYSAFPALLQWEKSGTDEEECSNLRTCRSWYGSLQDQESNIAKGVKAETSLAHCATLVNAGGGKGPGPSPSAPRRAFELFLPIVSRDPRPIPAVTVRRATSRDSALEKTAITNQDDGLRKCSTVVSLTERIEPIRAYNRLRTPSLCSKCSSILSLAGGSRYSLDAAGFVPVKNEQKTIVCKLCLDESSDLTVIGSCGCIYCTKCMQSYVEFEIVNGAYEISCPDAECRLAGALTLEEIGELVDDATMQKHLRYRMNHEVALDEGRAFCPRPGCEAVCSVKVRSHSAVHCPNCRLDFCSECNQEWHPGMTCGEAAGGGLTSSPLLPEGDLIKLCPMCRVPIEKDEGCAQMMCKRCKHVFCWYCLASLDDDFLLRHYDKGPCKNKLGHSRASVIWHRAQVVGIFAGFGLLLLVASPLLLLAAPCIVCCKCRLCNSNGAKNLDEVDDIEGIETMTRDEDKATTSSSS